MRTTLWLTFHVTHGESVLWGYELWRSGTYEARLLLLSHRDSEAAGLLISEGGPSIPAQDTLTGSAQLRLTTPQLSIPPTAPSFAHNLSLSLRSKIVSLSCRLLPEIFLYFFSFRDRYKISAKSYNYP